MKEGKTIQEMAKTLENIKETAQDFVVPTSKLEAIAVPSSTMLPMTPTETEADNMVCLGFQNGDRKNFAMNNYTGGQVAGFTGIPTQYFRRLESENAGLLVNNINHGLRVAEKDKPKRMLRTYTEGGTPLLRGFMSDKFFRLDNFDMFEAVYPIFEKHGLSIVSSELTDRKMYLKVLSPSLKTDLTKAGDTVQFGMVISNSDVGAGSARVEPLLYRLVCKNGVISNAALTKYHIGKSASESAAYELYSDATKNMDAKAFFMKVVDLIEGSLRKDVFEAEVEKIKASMDDTIKSAEPEKVIELSMKATGVHGEGKKKSILSALASGNDGAGYTRWGMVNSFTRAAQDEKISYEESIELERAGGKILELSPASWKRIASVN